MLQFKRNAQNIQNISEAVLYNKKVLKNAKENYFSLAPLVEKEEADNLFSEMTSHEKLQDTLKKMQEGMPISNKEYQHAQTIFATLKLSFSLFSDNNFNKLSTPVIFSGKLPSSPSITPGQNNVSNANAAQMIFKRKNLC